MRQAWKLVLYVSLNLLFVLVLVALTSLHMSLYSHRQDPMALLVIIPATVVFVFIGVLLLVLGNFYHIPVINQILPFVAPLGFFVPFILANTLAGPADMWETGYLIAIVIGIALGFLTLVTTLITVGKNSTR